MLLLFKATLSRQPTGLHPGSQRGMSLWQCSEIHSTPVLRPHFAIHSVAVHVGQILLQTVSSADCQMSSRQDGVKAFVCELEGGQQVLQSQSSL